MSILAIIRSSDRALFTGVDGGTESLIVVVSAKSIVDYAFAELAGVKRVVSTRANERKFDIRLE
jgi:hypothetical protein